MTWALAPAVRPLIAPSAIILAAALTLPGTMLLAGSLYTIAELFMV